MDNISAQLRSDREILNIIDESIKDYWHTPLVSEGSQLRVQKILIGAIQDVLNRYKMSATLRLRLILICNHNTEISWGKPLSNVTAGVSPLEVLIDWAAVRTVVPAPELRELAEAMSHLIQTDCRDAESIVHMLLSSVPAEEIRDYQDMYLIDYDMIDELLRQVDIQVSDQNLDKSSLNTCTTETFENILEDMPQALSENLDSIIDRLIHDQQE